MILASNPFISSYLQSDWLGKLIFWALFASSIVVWTLILHKSWLFTQVKRLSKEFAASFSEKEPLALQFSSPRKGSWLKIPHPFFEIYKTFKESTLKIISRNHFFAPSVDTTLSDSDLGLLEAEVQKAIASQIRKLEKNLFLLSTIVTLAPFLGLLGTVWGILLTFSSLSMKGISLSNASMLSGLSLALATTVAGLIIAIPALVGNSFLKNSSREFKKEMDDFSQTLLTAVELQYKRPEHASKSPAIL